MLCIVHSNPNPAPLSNLLEDLLALLSSVFLAIMKTIAIRQPLTTKKNAHWMFIFCTQLGATCAAIARSSPADSLSDDLLDLCESTPGLTLAVDLFLELSLDSEGAEAPTLGAGASALFT
mmetsp:Transcript_19107/g.39799  ORF Transcript_19107/g.39799 Transcript_19107/m.39799 type:complete len:120 (+) Transcript_19107:812-1171(+)